jgi:hypothetical protein
MIGRRGGVGLLLGLTLAFAACRDGSSQGGGGGRAGTGGQDAGGSAGAGGADAARADASDMRPSDVVTDATDTADAPSNADAAADAPSGADAAADAPSGADATSDAPGTADRATDVPSGADRALDVPSGAEAGTDGAGDGQSDSAPGSCSGSGVVLCESFETTTSGRVPTASPWLPIQTSTCGSSGSLLAVEDTEVRSGMAALEANTFSNQCVLSANLGAVLPELWVRVWLRIGGGGGASQFDLDEVTFFGVGGGAFADDPRVAVGVRGTMGLSPCAEAGLEVNTTGGSPLTGCTGQLPATDRWTCFELHLLQPGAGTTAELYVDGTQQTFAISDGTTGTEVTNPYTHGLSYLSLAVRQYDSKYNLPAYYDDVAVSTQRIGCQ